MCCKICCLFGTLLVVVFIQIGHAQLYPDDACSIKPGLGGKCKLRKDCPQPRQRNGKIVRLITCGYYEKLKYVCCPQMSSTPPTTKKPSLLVKNFNPNSSTATRNNIFTTQTDLDYPPGIRTTTRRPGITPLKTISQIKCDEYRRLVEKEIAGALALYLDAVPKIAKVPKCTVDGQPLIVGGQETEVGEFPHMAAIGYINPITQEFKIGCGGSLISEDAVLTAAHCTHSREYGEPKFVLLGEHNITEADPRASRQNITVVKTILHESYRIQFKYYDIAILKLKTPARIDNFTRPACLWQNPQVGKDDLIVTGWGETSSSKSSNVLQKVTLPIVKQQTCKTKKLLSKILPDGIRDEQLCIGKAHGGMDSCRGDSGGPLQIVDENNPCVYHVVGITSLGTGCALPNSVAVNTRVSSYIPWIENIVWPGQ